MATAGNDGTSIAITGLSCRFPGDGDNPGNYWKLVCEGKSAWSMIPKERFNGDAFWSGGKKRHGSVTKSGHFLKQDVSHFDANFFNISASEANAMDPQHRIALEVVYEALESAGYSVKDLAGTRTGVFMGHFTSDYKELVISDTDAIPPYATTGLNKTSLANRISWTFDLRGPSFALDTACSSSLVAFHLACQSLRAGESDIAIVGGTNVLLNPDMFVAFSGQGFLSPDGKCKSFDASGDGYGRGEGVAAIVLKRVDDAIVALDPLRAIIRATGSNQDGHTKSLTLPSADAQEALIRLVYQLANLDFDQTSYVEAHGTGTQAGDTTETLALSRTIAKGRSSQNKLVVGSVKANIGHLEAASGLAGVIKSVLMLEHGIIPPNIHFRNPNPMIDFENWNIQIPTQLMKWPSQGTRRISINSFGYGGTNAHAILDDAYSYLGGRGLRGLHYVKTLTLEDDEDKDEEEEEEEYSSQPNTPRVYVLTAQDRAGLSRKKKSLASYLRTKIDELHDDSKGEKYLADLAYTLSDKRSRLQWKTFALASSLDELADALESSDGGRVEVMSSSVPRLGFVFTGQGAQWATMGMALMAFPEFSASIEAADLFLRKTLNCPWSARAELSRGKGTSRLGLALYSQTLCTVLQVALVDLLRKWAVVPDAVVGHSSGEIAAAYCAGYLSREDAWRIAYCRGVVCSNMKIAAPDLDGAMMAVGASPDTCSAFIKRICPDTVSIACINSPSSVTLSGDAAAIVSLQAALQEENIFARKLLVDTAYHSKHMQLVAQQYAKAIADIQPRANTTTGGSATCKMYSSVTESEITYKDLGPDYWVRNLVSPVRFATAIQNLMRPDADAQSSARDAVDVLVEIGPHTALRGPATQSIQAIGVNNKPYLSAIVRNENAVETTLNLVGTLVAYGRPLELALVNKTVTGKNKTLVDLPSYPWNHAQQYWSESRLARGRKDRTVSASSLLGSPVPSFLQGERVWRGFLRLSEEPWMADHNIQDSVLYPGAGFLAMAIEAALQGADAARKVKGFSLRDIEFLSAMLVPEDDELEHTITLRPHSSVTDSSEEVWTEFVICSSPDRKSLVRNCRGLIRVCYDDSSAEDMITEEEAQKDHGLLRYKQASSSCKEEQQPAEFYQKLNDLGYHYGLTFANITEVLLGDGQSCGCVTIPSIGLHDAQRPHVIHPATLDAMFHLAFAAANSNHLSKLVVPMVPKSMDEMYISIDIAYLAHTKLKGYSKARKLGSKRQLKATIGIVDEEEQQSVLEISGLHCAEIAQTNDVRETAMLARKICSKLIWRPSINFITNEDIQRIVSTSTELAADVASASVAASATRMRNHRQLSEFINIIHHTTPTMHIVELAQETSAFAQDKTVLKDVLRTANYITLGYDGKTKFVSGNSSPAAETETSQVDQDLFQEHIRTADLVICSALSLAPSNIAHNARLLLKDDGRFCAIEAPEQVAIAKSILQEAGFTDLFQFGGSASGEPVFLVGSVESSENVTGAGLKEKDIVLIQPANANESVTALTEQLKATLSTLGYGTSIYTWGIDDASALKNKDCVALLEAQSTVLESLAEKDFYAVQTLITECKSLLWIDALDGASKDLINGLTRVVRNEIPGSQLQTLHVSSATLVQPKRLSYLICQLLDSRTSDSEFIVENDMVYTSRVIVDEELSAEIDDAQLLGADATSHITLSNVDAPLSLTMTSTGTVCFKRDNVLAADLEGDEVEINVKASTISSNHLFVDADGPPVFEAAGVIARVGAGVTKFQPGDSVVMYSLSLAGQTLQRTKEDFCHLLPSGYTFTQAISGAAAHAAAWYALDRIARIQSGQSILIHAAAEDVGQAAIQIARNFNVEIYATIEEEMERDLLCDTYDIPSDHIFNLRDSHAVGNIRNMTNNHGIDVILGLPTNVTHRRTSQCLAAFGTFVEIGLYESSHSKALDTRFVPQDTTFSSFNLSNIARKSPQLMAQIIAAVFELHLRGILKPIISSRFFSASEVESAVRYAQTEGQDKTIILTWDDKDSVPVIGSIECQPVDLNLRGDACYILVGGLGGLGRSLAMMLAENGARKLCFLSRSGAASASANDLISDLEELDVQVRCLQCDVSEMSALKHALDICSAELGPVHGVIQCAMVLRDTLFTNMSYDQWQESTLPKVQGTQNLHNALPDVDFFVALSSFAGTFGNRGQSNYAAGCAYQDALALQRREEGKKATTLDVGLMRDIGVLAENGMTDNLKEWEEPYGVREGELRNLVKLAIAGHLPAQVLTGLATGGSTIAAGISPPFYLSDAKFSIMATTDLEKVNGSAVDSNNRRKSDSIRALVSKSESLVEASGHVTASLVGRIAKMLQIEAEDVDTSRALHSYGLDSLVAIEIVDWALKEIEARVSVFDIMAAVPITATASKIANASALCSTE
ncbi:putative polyketide synthase [Trichoderma velutinum]